MLILLPGPLSRVLAYLMESELAMVKHVNSVVSGCFYQCRHLRCVRRSLPTETRHALLTSCIGNRLDNCNAILYGANADILHRLQMVLNAAARLVAGLGKYEHVTPLLRELHWLPVHQRIKFKIAILAFSFVRRIGPVYFSDVCMPLSDIPSRAALRAADHVNRFIPVTKTKIGSRSFRVAGLVVWNSLPHHLHSWTISRA